MTSFSPPRFGSWLQWSPSCCVPKKHTRRDDEGKTRQDDSLKNLEARRLHGPSSLMASVCSDNNDTICGEVVGELQIELRECRDVQYAAIIRNMMDHHIVGCDACKKAKS